MNTLNQHALITIAQMYAADTAATAAGVPGIELMTNAGSAVATHILTAIDNKDRVLVVCGTGNNGGDGLIVAEYLHQHNIPTDVILAGDPQSVSGDAARALHRLSVNCLEPDSIQWTDYTIFVDAIFGAGLSRDVSGSIASLISTINRIAATHRRRVISVDLPSGINGDTGKVCGIAVRAHETITFYRKKPGHLLLPGRSYCGQVFVSPIGIPTVVSDKVLTDRQPMITENDPHWWRDQCPHPVSDSHKYARGHAVVLSGGPLSTGAARMVCSAALRTGAGLVTLCSEPDALAVNAAQLTEVMLKRVDTPEQFREYLDDSRIRSVTLGPGLGIGERTRQYVKSALSTNRAVVLDADALTSFESQPTVLFAMIEKASGPVVLTPHKGEFNRLFTGLGDQIGGDKLTQTIEAAKSSGAIVVFKGPDTVIAEPSGETVISANAPPWLATAGSGDILAGTIAGWLTQGMPPMAAVSAACWMHGESANQFGPGLIATDIPNGYPAILKSLLNCALRIQ